MNLIPIIMSGGSGTRLWPISRQKYPKQFTELFDKPLQTMTIERLQKFGKCLIITTEKLKDLTEKDIIQNKLQVEKVIYEPFGKNTTAAVALSCKYLQMTGRSKETMGVFPSDSLISKEIEFEAALLTAVETAQNNLIVSVGIKPRGPETGFGYIQVKERALNTNRATEVLKFHEKPTLDQAVSFVNDGHYFWNAGIYIFKVDLMIELLKKYESDIWTEIDTLNIDLTNLNKIYEKLKSISIDYAVIEKLDQSQLRCVPCDIGWSDVGSWDALVDATAEINPNENSLKKHAVQLSAKGNSVFSKQKKSYSIVGANDLIIVDTADALMVCKKNETQKVKDLVEILKRSEGKITDEHVFENRPWGRFEVLRDESYFKSKIIRVEPGHKLSYQSHEKRAEHWVIVRGQAVVTLNGQEHQLKAGDHIFIPQKAKHRVHNRGLDALEFIEVQIGDYFGEDDITRYEDEYGRR